MKGLAIIAMICHHLNPPEFHIQNIPWYWNIISSVGKVCVAMFVFCSGYGLSAQYVSLLGGDNEIGGGRIKSTILFLLRRFVKFYANYWPIFLVFVPITCLFNRSLEVAYGAGNIPLKLISDFLGIKGDDCYNVTWWFNQLIIILYLLFPLYYWRGCNRPLLYLILSFFLCIFSGEISGYTVEPLGPFLAWRVQLILLYSFPFLCGLMWARFQGRVKAIEQGISHHRVLFLIISLFLFLVCIYLRIYSKMHYLSGIRVDGLLTISIAFLIVILRTYTFHIRKVLVFLGIYSANMYLTHTFINSYWPTAMWLHTYTGGIVKYVLLLGASLILSVAIEYVKKQSGYNEAISAIISKIEV